MILSKANAINGVFSVYKPKGWTSRKVTDFVQNTLSAELLGVSNPLKIRFKDKVKIGHGGTLDPMAEGVLVLGVGKGCKELSNYLKGTKEYLVTAKFGESTDTYDAEGQVNQKGKIDHLSQSLIIKTLPAFTGHVTQVPPIYSALKIQGKRLYDYARQDIPLPEPIQPRQVYIEEIDLLDFSQDTCVFRVVCGGGTYMRSLVHDMATHMGTFAHMTALKRTRQGTFTVDKSLALDSVSVTTVLEQLKSGP